MAGCAIVMASACGAHSAAGNVRATAHVSTSRAAPAAAPHIAKYPRCRAAQLSARLGDIGMGAGSSWQYVVLTNKGGGPCALNGDPVKLMGVRPDGTKKALAHISPDDPRTLSLTGPASLRPGQSARVAIVTPHACAAGVAGRTDDYSAVGLEIGATGELVVQLPSGRPLNASCGADVGA
jgi:hypothetical protein